MKLYHSPKIGIVRFEPQDVVRTSDEFENVQQFGTGENFVFDDLT